MPLEPLDEAAVVAAWSHGMLSEGEAARVLGGDRLHARDRRAAVIARGMEAADWAIPRPEGAVELAALRKFIYHRQANGADESEWEALEAVLVEAERLAKPAPASGSDSETGHAGAVAESACRMALEFLDRQGYGQTYCESHGEPIRRILESAIAAFAGPGGMTLTTGPGWQRVDAQRRD